MAPLGTALTEDQIRLLWRMAPEPVLCFDGDAAGRRAAFRAVETVLPHLKPGFSVQFAFLPDGLDPDDLVRQHGAAEFQAMLDSKLLPLFDVLMQREEQQQHGASTPEQRASLEARLQALVARIADRGVRAHYERELRETCGPRTARSCARSPGRMGAAPHDSPASDATTPRSTGGWARGRPSARAWAPCRGPQRWPPAPMRSNELAERSLPLPARETLLIAHAPQPSLAAGGPVRGGCRADPDLAAAGAPARCPARAAGAERRP